MGLERLTPGVAGRRGHIHDFPRSPDREYAPERKVLRRWAQRHFPSVCLDHVHDDGWNQHDEERHRPELRRHIVDAPQADMPDDEPEGQEPHKKKGNFKHGLWGKASSRSALLRSIPQIRLLASS